MSSDLRRGPRNAISDVPGVSVGHVTLAEGDVQTGVTAVLPHGGDLFRTKLPAAAHVINGFGKSCGLVQVEELGCIETPLLLTNTFSVGTCATALIKHAIAANSEIGRQWPTVNPVVFECNDGYLNDLHAFAVTEDHALQAIAEAKPDFAQGAVGAGRGMSCFGLKGGIGSASRLISLDGRDYVIGVLVLTNFGRKGDLRINGDLAQDNAPHEVEKGSVIVILATDLPLSDRQLKRVAKRAGIGLARIGSFIGHGSGDIVLAFSTANSIPHDGPVFRDQRVVAEERLDPVFRAAAFSTEEAVLKSMLAAESVAGRDGNRREALRVQDQAGKSE